MTETGRPSGGRKRRPSCLAGTHLHLDERGIYCWRRVDPATGRRTKRSTGMRTLELAMRKAAQFEEEWDRRRAGLKSYDGWTRELEPLVEQFLASLEARAPRVAHLRMALGRALEALRLRTAADLDDLGALDDRLRALERKGLPRTTLRRCYQDPLRSFAKWLSENHRVLDRDPLREWKPLAAPRGKSRPRKALLPDYVARALLALEVLDEVHGRPGSSRLVFVVLLVTAPRAGALLALDVDDLDHRAGRLDLGEDVGCKRKGAAALDAKTLAELARSLDGRDEGPMFTSPRGGRWQLNRLRTTWREAFGLGVVDALWPADTPRDLALAVQVAATLARGKPRRNGGNPRRMKAETWAAVHAHERQVLELADRMRSSWVEQMRGVDLHCLRKTHRTWARARRVLGEAIDAQLGHDEAEDLETTAALRAAAGSETGRKHYMDASSALFDPRASAEAVRAALDEALAALAQDERSQLARGSGRVGWVGSGQSQFCHNAKRP